MAAWRQVGASGVRGNNPLNNDGDMAYKSYTFASNAHRP